MISLTIFLHFLWWQQKLLLRVRKRGTSSTTLTWRTEHHTLTLTLLGLRARRVPERAARCNWTWVACAVLRAGRREGDRRHGGARVRAGGAQAARTQRLRVRARAQGAETTQRGATAAAASATTTT